MIEAARTVFAEKGYAHATIEEVAHRAEFGKGTVYNYFEGGKEDLLVAVLDEIYDRLCLLIETSLSAPAATPAAFRKVFQAFVERFFDFYADDPHVFIILAKEARQFLFSTDQSTSQYLIRQNRRVVEALMGPIEKAQQAGLLKAFPVDAVAHAILGNLNGSQMHLCMSPADCSDSEMAAREASEFICAMLMDGLLNDERPDAH